MATGSTGALRRRQHGGAMTISPSMRAMLGGLILAGIGSAGAAFATDPYESAPTYLHGIASGASLTKVVTTGQMIPLLGGAPGETFRFVGIPDGTGIVRSGVSAGQGQRLATGGDGEIASGPAGRFTLFVNHEFNQSAGGVAGPLPSGA